MTVRHPLFSFFLFLFEIQFIYHPEVYTGNDMRENGIHDVFVFALVTWALYSAHVWHTLIEIPTQPNQAIPLTNPLPDDATETTNVTNAMLRAILRRGWYSVWSLQRRRWCTTRFFSSSFWSTFVVFMTHTGWHWHLYITNDCYSVHVQVVKGLSVSTEEVAPPLTTGIHVVVSWWDFCLESWCACDG